MDRLPSESSMTARNLEARIVKLETGGRGGDEVLLLWRGPRQDVHTVVLAAKSAGQFGPGDRVLCAEWFGDGEKPQPRWIRRIKSDVTEGEMDSLNRTAEKLAAVDDVSDGNKSLTHYSDEQLWYGVLGVET
jgi:hypothetical protein